MPTLFSPLKIRDVSFRNRIAVSPMCQYSCQDGFATDWHLVHLGSRAVGGAGLVIVEATAVQPQGRISPQDLGLWQDGHIAPLARVADFIRDNGSVAGIQLAQAGRKASTAAPWDGGRPVRPEAGGWLPVAPSALAFDSGSMEPHTLSVSEIADVVDAFEASARRALAAGFQVVEIHAAHGYLLHEFLSPLSNLRQDEYGGSLENRMRLVLEVTRRVRAVWPESLPLFVRISATDWADGGWTLAESIQLARQLKPLGVDLVDCSSGGLIPTARIPIGPGYQVPLAEAIRREADLPTGAVGMITDARQADEIIRAEQADLVLLARELLRNPHWPLQAAQELGVDIAWPKQYERAKPHR